MNDKTLPSYWTNRILKASPAKLEKLTDNPPPALRALIPAAMAWFAKCRNPPTAKEYALEMLNDLTGGYGTEGITPDGHVYPVATYVNKGDTYDRTIVHDLETDKFIETSWGDWLEAWEAEQE